MEILKSFFEKEITKRVLSFLLVILFFVLTQPLINLFLLTFLFTYLISSIQEYIFKKLGKVMTVKRVIITAFLYIFIITSISSVLYIYIPKVIDQSKEMLKQFKEMNGNVNSQTNSILEQQIINFIKDADINGYIEQNKGVIFDAAKSIGEWSKNVILALILSLFFIIEKEKIKKFFKKFEDSKISSIYKNISYFGRNFLNSFGKVIQAQILIAMINTSITTIGLYILGFNNLMVLGCMVFILSLVPVAGVIVSLIPIGLMAYKIGGLLHIFYVICMILIVHAVESYFLNPKFMSSKTELPVFLIFMILIISEHFMGMWGLLIGIPLFMFILDMINVKSIEKK